MRHHLDTIGILFMVYGLMQAMGIFVALLLLIYAGVFGAVGIGAEDLGMVVAGGVFGVVAVLIFLLEVVLVVGYTAVGHGIRNRRAWTRVPALVLAGVALINVPLGTMLGVFTLIVMLNEEVAAEYAVARAGGL